MLTSIGACSKVYTAIGTIEHVPGWRLALNDVTAHGYARLHALLHAGVVAAGELARPGEGEVEGDARHVRTVARA